jgi:predicted nucleic acid-binding protein
MNLVDTSGWMEYFFSGRNAAWFSEPIEKTEELLVSVVCIYEVFKKINVTVDEANALRAVAQMKQGRVVDVSEDISLSAALISIRHKLPMADSLIYATARVHDASVWTQDAHFEHLPGVEYRPAGGLVSEVE